MRRGGEILYFGKNVDFWKNYIDRIITEENDCVHELERDVAEGPVDNESILAMMLARNDLEI